MNVGMQLFAASTLVVAQALAGAWVWSWVRPKSNALERLGVGFAIGSAASAVLGVVLFPLSSRSWMLPLGLVALVALVVRFRKGMWIPPVGMVVSRSQTVALAFGTVAGWGSLIWAWRSYPLDGSGATYHGDMLFFEAISRSLATVGPSDSTLMTGSELRYHWMAYAWAGQIADAAAPEPFLMLTRVLPIAAIFASVLIVVAWSARISRHPWSPILATALLVFGGYVGASFGTILNFDSPSQQISTVWLLGLSIAFLAALRVPHAWPVLSVIAFLAAATTSGKVSAGAVAVAGTGLVVVTAVVRKEPWMRRASLAFAVLLLASLAAFLVWIAGGNDAGGLGFGLLDKMATVIGLNPVRGTLGVIIGTALLLVAVASRWIGLVWLLKDRKRRWSPFVVMSTGMAAAGLLTLVFLGQGINDSWFALSASAPLSVAGAAGAGLALKRAGMPGAKPSLAVLVMGAGGLAAAAIVLVLWRQPEDAMRWLGPLVAVGLTGLVGFVALRCKIGVLVGLTIGLTVVACLGRALPLAGSLISTREGTRLPSEFTLSESFELRDNEIAVTWGQEARDAAAWLNARTAVTDVIATNRTRSPLVAALVGRPMYLSGGHYQAPYGPAGAEAEVQRRDTFVHSFVNTPSEQNWQALCEAGVSWLWVNPTLTTVRDWSPFMNTELVTEEVVLAVANSPC